MSQDEPPVVLFALAAIGVIVALMLLWPDTPRPTAPTDHPTTTTTVELAPPAHSKPNTQQAANHNQRPL